MEKFKRSIEKKRYHPQFPNAKNITQTIHEIIFRHHANLGMMLEIPRLQIDIDTIQDNKVRKVLTDCFQVIEKLYQETVQLKSENQKLRDENNRLKGEQGKPEIKPNNRDISSNRARNDAEETGAEKIRGKRGKKNLKPDRIEVVTFPKSELPEDATFKGYESVILSGITIKVENVEYKLEKYHSKSRQKTYIARLPGGCSRDYDASVQAMVIVLNKIVKSTQSRIRNFLTGMGLAISTATISRMISETNMDVFIQEKTDILQAGIRYSSFIQSDDTMARVKGKNYHAHIFGNEYFTVYFTEEKKNRLTVLDCLRSKRPRQYLFNEETFRLLQSFQIPKSRILELDRFEKNRVLTAEQFESILRQLYPDENKLKNYQSRIREAAYIAAYHQEPDCILALLTDDAPQYQCIGLFHALCWIHEARHYNKMSPVIPYHQAQLKAFLDEFWKLYTQMLDYKKIPASDKKVAIEEAFDTLCDFKSTFQPLKDRIIKTRANKTRLLYVLKDSSIPLHNNDSELSAREKVRDRDIHLHTMSTDGTRSADALLSIISTARKLNVNPANYISDRLSGACQLPALADLICARANQINPEARNL